MGNTSFPTGWNATPVVDFLLLGGFNEIGRENYNTSVVSGMFDTPTNSSANSAWFSMQIEHPHFTRPNNHEHLIYYPDCDRVLGDCCAEYVEERDEVLCFGGRGAESDTAFACESPAVLEFSAPSNTPRWVYNKYPPQPHPRWSAASVLIKDLVRKGETEPCDRIFILGGRNRDGFVPEVDVFNLRHNTWETDWKGLLDGELETLPPSMGGSGGTTIIIQGGGANVRAIPNATIGRNIGGKWILRAVGVSPPRRKERIKEKE